LQADWPSRYGTREQGGIERDIIGAVMPVAARAFSMDAADRGRLIVPHCWKTGIGIAASAHLSAAAAHCPFIEFLPAPLAESPLRRDLVAEELQMVDGLVPLPRKPGLGIELNPDALKKYCVARIPQ
jgi:L-alanine-DL-glutamate epimerase-like enolase superfamily enzyme